MKRVRETIGFAMVIVLGCLISFSTLGFANEPAKGQPLFLAKIWPTGIIWEPQIRNEGVVVTVTGSWGVVFQWEFGAGAVPSMNLLDEKGYPLADGQYSYELRATPVVDPKVRKMLDDARESEERSILVADLQETGMLPSRSLVHSGYFRVLNGKILVPSGSEEKSTLNQSTSKQSTSTQSASTSDIVKPLDQVIADDLIVTGSACVGFDCLTDGTENFGFDTIKLKENNLRIFFDDTSATAGFPANDWRITVNDSSSGGGNYFSIDDATGARVPFRIDAGAPNNSLYISSSGKIGHKTSTPAMALHIVNGDTPGVRLDQDTSSGWTAQVWDIAGNESNFFIRDTTGGSTLPFRIQPGAPTNSLNIKADGKIGIGTWSPAHDLDVLLKTTSLVQLGNTEADATTKAARMVVRHYNNAEEPVYLFGAASTSTNNFVALGGGSPLGNAATQIDLFTAPDTTTPVGTARITIKSNGYVGVGTQSPSYPLQMAGGAYTNGSSWVDASSREYKENIEVLSTEEALEAIKELNPVKYAYKTDQTEKRVGFIAEEVPELISMKDRKGLSPMDVVAVLTKVVQEQQKLISVLSEKVSELERTLK